MITLGDLWQALYETCAFPPPPRDAPVPLLSQQLTAATQDSREVVVGALFVALQGEHRHGNEFIGDALRRGALAVLAERHGDQPVLSPEEAATFGCAVVPPAGAHAPDLARARTFCFVVEDALRALQAVAAWWRGRFDLCVVGITGSVGKTTAKEITAALLGRKEPVLKNPGSRNNEIGLPLTLLGLGPEHSAAVLEMGMYVPGDIALLADIARPSIGVVLNVGPVHAERAGSVQTIALAKSELVQALPPDGLAVLNGDDPLVRPMAARTAARSVFVGETPGLDVWAEDVIGLGLNGISFTMHFGPHIALGAPAERVHMRLLGRHHVLPVLAAVAVALERGWTPREVVAALPDLEVSQRLRLVPGPGQAVIIDDTYNASPASVLAALDFLEELPGRRIAVLGDMLELGPFTPQGHEKVGARAAEVVEALVTVGPYSKITAQAAREAGLAPERIIACQSAEQAVEAVQRLGGSPGYILIKGSRAMRMEEIVRRLAAQERPCP
jgi:UDP-N-acetylmuramoyl-tripeptide--D-alanyl-D-alanine ligase